MFASSNFTLKSSQPGAPLGLELVLLLDQLNYMKKGMTESAGGR
jgi:hypothetical protein